MNKTASTWEQLNNRHKESIESLSADPIVQREKLNQTPEMKQFLPQINEHIESIKKRWINIVYTADQRIASESSLDGYRYIEATYEVATHLSVLQTELQKYPEWVSLPKEIVVWALIINDKEYLQKNKIWYELD